MRYDDIINLPHPEPKNHVRMPIKKRAAQFAPFAALAGYKEAIAEAQRKQEEKIAEIDRPVEFDDDIKTSPIPPSVPPLSGDRNP